MGTTAEKLAYLAQAKVSIKTAIEAMGVAINDIPFGQYGSKIEEIVAIAPLVNKSIEVVLPEMLDGVTSIGAYAFYQCTSLTTIYIPSSVTSIGNYALSGCTSLSTIWFDGTPQQWESVSKGSYWNSNTGNYTIIYGSLGLSYVSNGNGTCYISGKGKCTDTTIALPAKSPSGDVVTSIGADAFKNDTSITFVYISEGIASIGNNAFSGCTNINTISISSTITSIGSGALYGDTSLAYILFNGTNTQWNAISKGSHWDDNTGAYTLIVGSAGLSYTSNGDGTCYVSGIGSCTDTDIIVPIKSPAGDDVVGIGANAFRYDASITSVILDTGITYIGQRAFDSCPNLTEITIPPTLTSIGLYAFGANTSSSDPAPIDKVYISDLSAWCNIDFYSYESNPLYNSYGKLYINGTLATNITIPNGVSTVKSYTFVHCSSIISVTTSATVTSIGERAFYYCSSLTSVTFSNGLNSIGNYAFYDCDSLTSVTFPNGLVSIGERAFYNCSSLTSVDIGTGVTSIGTRAFAYCYSMTTFKVRPTTPPVIDELFGYTTSEGAVMPPCIISVPSGSVTTYKTDSRWYIYEQYIEAIGG